MEYYVYDGSALKVEDIVRIARQKLSLSDQIQLRVQENRRALEQQLALHDARFYGINTGFGALYSVAISPEDVAVLQTNLLRSHACGVGPAVPRHIVRLLLLLKIISLSQAQSGVRYALIEILLALYNHDILPVIPSLGSLGASGDLAPLAHLCLPLIGEGEVVYKREQMPARRALTLAGLEPLELEAKEGLALINGTQYSLAWLVYAVDQVRQMAEAADMCAAMSIDAFDAHPSSLDAEIHQVRGQLGQIRSAEVMRHWLTGSSILIDKKEHLQDPYSFRCAPQVHGASRDVISYAEMIADREINAVTDNPLVLGKGDDVRILSGGNFHAQPLALAADFLAIAIAEYGSISERRSYLLLGGQRGLPPALAQRPGLESGMMICQYTAAAIVNRSKILTHPASTDSIVTSAGQEDHVSMAANAGIKLYEILQNTWKLLAIEWMIANQAMDYRRPRTTSPALEEKHTAYRLLVAPLTADRSNAQDIEQSEMFLRQQSYTRL